MPEMKDSGVEWIGKIPVDWDVYLHKHFLHEMYSGGTPTSGNGNFYDIDGVPFITISDMSKTDHVVNTRIGITETGIRNKHLRLLKKGTVIYSIYATIGEVAELTIPAYINQALLALYPNEAICTKQFYKYNLKAMKDFVFWQANGNTQFNLNAEKVKNFYFVTPPLHQQILIARFLDMKCSEIDALAADIQKEISTLEEYKKSVIFEAVCHGLSETDDMRDTDSDVWSRIPESWKLVGIKYLFEIVKRIAGKEGFDVLSVTQKGLKVKDITSGDGQLADNYSGYQFVYPTDYVMNHMDLLTGWVDLSSMFGVTSPDYRVFRLKDKVSNDLEYYKYVMQCCYMNRIFYSLGQGVSNLGRWRLQTSSFNNFKVPVPPTEEQHAIAEYLNSKINGINEVITMKQKQLEVLYAYKKSVIYEYVTGKKEVPENEC